MNPRRKFGIAVSLLLAAAAVSVPEVATAAPRLCGPICTSNCSEGFDECAEIGCSLESCWGWSFECAGFGVLVHCGPA